MELLVECINAGIVTKHDTNTTPSAFEENDESGGKLRHLIFVQQVKIVDSKGALKTVYPSRVDLDFENSNKIRVVRAYDDEKK